MKMFLIVLVILTFSYSVYTDSFEKARIAYVNRDYNTAIALFEDSCNDRRADGCLELAKVYMAGFGGTIANQEKALELLKRS